MYPQRNNYNRPRPPQNEANYNYPASTQTRQKTTSYLDYVAVEAMKAVLGAIEDYKKVDMPDFAAFCYELATQMENVRNQKKAERYEDNRSFEDR